MKKYVLIILITCLHFALKAQEKDSPWSLTSTNNASFYSGNIDKFAASSITEVAHVDSTYEFSVGYMFNYGEVRESKYLLLHQASVYYDYRPFHKFSPFANVTGMHNVYKGFELRLTTVVGAKYTLIKEEDREYSFSAGVLYDHSDFADLLKGDEPIKETTDVLRLSVRPKIKFQVGENAEFKHFTFFQPSIDDFDDYLVLSQSNFSVGIIDHVSLSIGYWYNFNSRPAYERIKKEDQRLMFGVKVNI